MNKSMFLNQGLSVGMALAAVCAVRADPQVWTPTEGATTLGGVTMTLNGMSLSAVGDHEFIRYSGTYLPAADTGDWKVIAAGKTLADYDVFCTVYNGNHASDVISGTAYPTYVKEEGGVRTMQLPVLGGSYTKVCKIALKQDGANIVAQHIWAKYCEGNRLTEDFDNQGEAQGVHGYSIATETTTGYGVDTLELHPKGEIASLQVQIGSPVAVNTVAVSGGADLTAPSVTLDATLPETSVTEGVLTIKGGVGEAFGLSAVVSGANGALRFVSTGGKPTEGESTYEKEVRIPEGFSDSYVIPNTRLSDIVGLHGWTGGGSIGKYEGDAFFFERRGDFATCQFQFHEGPFLKCVPVEMKQVGANVQVRSQYGMYIESQLQPGEYKFTGGEGKVYNQQYAIDKLRLSLSAKAGEYDPMLVALDGKNSTTSSTLAFDGGESGAVAATLSTDAALPQDAKGVVEIGSGALVRLNYGKSGPGDVKAQNTFRVLPGGEFRHAGSFSIGHKQNFEIVGGRVGFGTSSASSEDAATYIGGLIYRDGAETYGASPRIGCDCAVRTLKVGGTSPSVSHNGLIITYTYSYGYYTFDVEDVTSSEAVDFTIEGAVRNYDNGYNGYGKLKKDGAGTLRLMAPCTSAYGPFLLQKGTLELGASGVFAAATMNATLADGTLAALADTANSCGVLDITGDAAISLGAGAELEIGSIGTWTEGKKLAVTLADGARLRVGTSACLSAAQLRRIRVNGLRCAQDESGYLSGYRSGMMLLFR